jgi:glutathione S-transferase/GST-like protein
MLQLFHGEPNTFSLKALIALKEKGVEFASHYQEPLETLEAAGKRGTKDIEVMVAFDGEAPVAEKGDAALAEALFFDIYVDEAYPGPDLRPGGAYGRWRVLMWARMIGEMLSPAVCTLGCRAHLAPYLAKQDKAKVEKLIAALPMQERREAWKAALNNTYSDDLLADCRRKVEFVMGKFEEQLNKNPWLTGDEFSIADIDAFGLTYSLPTLVPDLVNSKTFPKVSDWLERVAERPAVQEALAYSQTGAPHQGFLPGPEHSRWG